jgi:hypothetical protein
MMSDLEKKIAEEYSAEGIKDKLDEMLVDVIESEVPAHEGVDHVTIVMKRSEDRLGFNFYMSLGGDRRLIFVAEKKFYDNNLSYYVFSTPNRYYVIDTKPYLTVTNKAGTGDEPIKEFWEVIKYNVFEYYQIGEEIETMEYEDDCLGIKDFYVDIINWNGEPWEDYRGAFDNY